MSILDHDRLATDWWEGFAQGDVERLVSMFAPDSTFWDPRFPPFAGRDNIRLYYEDLLGKTTAWGGVRSAVYVASESEFAVHTRTKFTMRGMNKVIDFPMVGFFKHRNGQLSAYEEYWDTGYMLRQLGIPAFPPSAVHH
jgi:ketosteroid isomerase-like protein